MNTGIEHELRKAVEARCRPNIDDIDARELLEYLDGMRKALQELELASDARIAELEAALREAMGVLTSINRYSYTDMEYVLPEDIQNIEKALKGQP